ncbi:MAG: homocysteine S-methyltransferase family protein [Bacteroidetes bacterium]|nr:homocysteine S-methyltransferase family protein [Bacteroidota bacterium]
MNLSEKIERFSGKKPLILDGAVGSYLTSNGVLWDDNLWSSYGNISHPGLVKTIHAKYISAGADIITSNTFRTNPIALKRANIDISEEDFVRAALLSALFAVNNSNVLIAGSNAPAEDCYQSERTIGIDELIYNHKRHIDLLYENGAEIILNETQSHIDEIQIICEYCHSNKIPFILSLFFTEDMKILSGESVSEVVQDVLQYSPLAIGFNCIFNNTFQSFINNNLTYYDWGFYLNCGAGNLTDKGITCGVSEKEYVSDIKKLIHPNLKFVGSCCGSSPAHTMELRRVIDELC